MGAKENLAKLPDQCAAILLEDGSPILIVAGGHGYIPAPNITDPRAFNERHGITPAQVWAMMGGSAFGWDVPGADPDTYANGGDPYQPMGRR